MQGQLQMLRQRLRKDGWLLGALAAAVLLCLLAGSMESKDAAMTSEEARAARILSAIDGAGNVDIAIFYADSEEAAVPCGAVVVADGADDVAVRLRLSQAVATLLGIDNTQIDIFKRGDGS